jgi:hypothetical protein
VISNGAEPRSRAYAATEVVVRVGGDDQVEAVGQRLGAHRARQLHGEASLEREVAQTVRVIAAAVAHRRRDADDVVPRMIEQRGEDVTAELLLSGDEDPERVRSLPHERRRVWRAATFASFRASRSAMSAAHWSPRYRKP